VDRNEFQLHIVRVFTALAMLPSWSNVAAQTPTLILTQIADFTGRGKATASPISEGALACIAESNAKGKLQTKLVTMDDAFKPEETGRLAKEAVRNGTTAFIASLGSANALALADVADAENIPVIGAIAGATSVRAAQRPSLFFIRASLRQEGVQAVKHLAATGLRRIGVLHTADGFGKDGLESVRAALTDLGLAPPVAASYDPAVAKDSGTAVDVLKGADAVIVFGSSKVLYDFVTRMRRESPNVVLVAASAANMSDLVKEVGVKVARGVRYMRSMPMPSERTVLGRTFRETWKKYGRGDVGPLQLEGCLAARIAIRAALSTGPKMSPGKLLRYLKTSPPQSFGEFVLDFRRPGNEGSLWVDIAVVGADGKLRD
jgi:branched-chain amino acid transport system substrate-binding protein